MATKIVIVILAITFIPEVFNMANKLQTAIIKSEVLPKIILGKTNKNVVNMDNYGYAFAANMLSLFYYVDPEYCEGYYCTDGNLERDKCACNHAEIAVEWNLEQMREHGTTSALDDSFSVITNKHIKYSADDEKTKGAETKALIRADIMALVVGGFIIYILVLYAIDLGTRYGQLIFLQIMAPIAILGYLSPKKDNMLQKWGKQYLITYIDLFIRLSIIYFVLLLVTVLGQAFHNGNLFANIGEISFSLKVLTYVVLVMGLLVFAHKAPKMLQELLPSLGGSAGIGFGLGAKSRYEPTVKAAKGMYRYGTAGLGLVAAPGRAIASAIRNKTGVWSAIKGTGLGVAASLKKGGGFRKSGDAIRQSMQEDIDTREAGGSPFSKSFLGGFKSAQAKRQDVVVQKLENMSKAKDNLSNAIMDLKEFKQLKSLDNLMANATAEEKLRYDTTMKQVEQLARQRANGALRFDDGTGRMVGYEEAVRARTSGLTIGGQNQLLDAHGNNIIEFDTSAAKQENIRTKFSEAHQAARDIQGVHTYTDAAGRVRTINIASDDIADHIGDITDQANTAASGMKSSREYIEAHADAKGNKK